MSCGAGTNPGGKIVPAPFAVSLPALGAGRGATTAAEGGQA
jgi:hypothetical protein